VFALPTTQNCAHVRFVKGLSAKCSNTARNVLLFGITHSPWQEQNDRRDCPTWVSDLMIAQKLVDACILGWMLSPTEAKANIVVVVGGEHVKGIIDCVRHLAQQSLARLKRQQSILTDAGDTLTGSYLSKPVAID
jgi:hypothetical protein